MWHPMQVRTPAVPALALAATVWLCGTAAAAAGPQGGPAVEAPAALPPPAARAVDVGLVLGAGAVALMLVNWACESRVPDTALGTAAAALGAAAYGFASGAWPLGVALTVFAGTRLWRWAAARAGRRRPDPKPVVEPDLEEEEAPPPSIWTEESRVARLFGRP